MGGEHPPEIENKCAQYFAKQYCEKRKKQKI
jgi:hypothetical protein